MTDSRIEREGDSGFKVVGEMTFQTVRQLLVESKKLFGEEQELSLNLSAVRRADSAGLALLLEWLALMNEKGGKLMVQGLPSSILDIADLCQVESTLDQLQQK